VQAVNRDRVYLYVFCITYGYFLCQISSRHLHKNQFSRMELHRRTYSLRSGCMNPITDLFRIMCNVGS
jgi:hypothetical protein